MDAPDAARAKVAVFRCFLLALIAVESWERAARLEADPGQLLRLGLAVVASVAASCAWRPRLASIATIATACVVLADFAAQFPGNPNHQYLQLVILAFLILLRSDVDDEVTLLMPALRWLLVVGLFYAGLQKLLYGLYFEGEFLAFTIVQNERFATILQYLMSSGEFERLSKIVIQEGAGPFRVDSALFVLASNLAYGTELVLPAMLLVPSTRKLAVLAIFAYFIAIESAAREVFFGGMMAALALCFGPPGWLRSARPIAYAGLAILLATSFGVLPRWFFS